MARRGGATAELEPGRVPGPRVAADRRRVRGDSAQPYLLSPPAATSQSDASGARLPASETSQIEHSGARSCGETTRNPGTPYRRAAALEAGQALIGSLNA